MREESTKGKKKSFLLGYSMVLNWFIAWAIFNFVNAVSLAYWREPVANLHGYSVATVLDMSTWSSILVGFLLLFLPKYLSKFGSAKILSFGAVLGGITFLLAPHAPTATVLGIMIALDLLWGGFYCSISTMNLVAKWFPRTKGTVMGIITAGGILASGVMLPIFVSLMNSMGVTKAMTIFGIIIVIYGVVSFFWLKETPEEVGLLPDNKPMTEEEKEKLLVHAHDVSTWSYSDLLKCPKFWLVTIGWTLFLVGTVAFSMVMPSAMAEAGLAMGTIVFISSIMGYIQAGTSFLSGIVDTKFGNTKASIIFAGIMGVGSILLGLFGMKGAPAAVIIILWILVTGFGGTPNNLMGSQVLNIFGPKGYSTVYVLFQAILNARMLGNWIDARSLSMTGRYLPGVTIGGIVAVIGLVIAMLAGNNLIPSPQEKQEN